MKYTRDLEKDLKELTCVDEFGNSFDPNMTVTAKAHVVKEWLERAIDAESSLKDSKPKKEKTTDTKKGKTVEVAEIPEVKEVVESDKEE